MKTAISVPDEVFAQAERLAKHLKLSRSELYSRAVYEYIARNDPQSVTNALNQVCAEVEDEPEPAYRRASQRTLRNTEW